MADEFQSNICSGNWWDTTARNNKFNNSGSSSTTSTELNNSIGISYGWPTTDMASRSTNSVDSVSVSGGGGGGGGCSMVFGDTQKLQGHDSAGGGGESGGVLSDHSLQMMGLGLPSQGMEWNQALIRSGKAEGGFRSMLQDDHHLNPNTNYQQETGMATSPQQLQWRQQKVFSGGVGEESSSSVHRGFSLDQPQFASHTNSGDSVVTCQGLSIGSSNFQMDNSALYGSPSPSTILQGFQSPFDQNRPLEYPNYAANYGMNSNDQLFPSLSKFPHFMRTNSPPKQPPHNQLHFSNNATFWNASATAMTDVRSSFLPSLQTQFSAPTFDEKPKPNKSEARDSSSSVVKKSGGEVSMKRPRNETSSPLPPFKVRKEKMGDRITALQQLVSPFGKTDTASVLSEAIEYIKFLHEQVTVLSTPYMKSGASIQHHHQSSEKSKDPEGPKQDLRSRGLCLVPVSSTFPVTHETTVDFWTPTFGGTFR